MFHLESVLRSCAGGAFVVASYGGMLVCGAHACACVRTIRILQKIHCRKSGWAHGPATCGIFARVRASELMPRSGGAQVRIKRATLHRFASQMVGFMVIRVAPVFARMGQILPCLAPPSHLAP